MPDKKQEFVVTDKRKFTIDGEARPVIESEESAESSGPIAPQPPPATQSAPSKEQASAPAPGAPPVPPPPSADEQRAQHDAY
jgi:hypothetical protein